MKLSKILMPMFATVIAITFNACTADDTSGEVVTQKIPIDVNCTAISTSVDIATYITTISGDSIVEDVTGTMVSIFVDANNVKKVCLVSGRAHIERKVIR